MVMLGLLDPVLDSQLIIDSDTKSYGLCWISFGLISGAILGIVATAAWRRLDWKSSKPVLWGVALGLVAVCYSTFLTWGANPTKGEPALGASFEVFPIINGEGALTFWPKYLGALTLGAAFLWLSIRGLQWMQGRLKSKWSKVKWSRTTMLIGVAVAMFVIGTIQNVFFPRGLLAGIEISFSQGSTTNHILAGLTLLAGFLFLLIASLMFATGRANFWKHLFLFCMFGGGLFFVFSYFVSNHNLERAKIAVSVLLGIATLLWTSIVVSTGRKFKKDLASNEDSTTYKKWPCLWSVLAIAVTLSVSILLYFFDPVPLVGTQDWKTAAYSRSIQRKSGNQVRIGSYMFGWARGFYSLSCDFEDNAAPDVLGDHEIPGMAVASISGMNPEIETGNITTLQYVQIADSTTCTKQLRDLLNSPTTVGLKNIEVVDPDESVEIDGSYIALTVDGEHRIASLLKSIKSADNAIVRINSEKKNKGLHPSDLEELIRFSQRVPVYLDEATLRQFTTAELSPDVSELSLRNLIVDWRGSFNAPAPGIGEENESFEDSEYLEFLIATDVTLKFDEYATDPRFWDIVFAKGKSVDVTNCGDRIKEGLDSQDWKKNLTLFGWQFGSNDKGEPTHLFLPDGDRVFHTLGSLDRFDSVETLCFDQDWLFELSPTAGRGFMFQAQNANSSLQGLDKFPNLKRLVLSRDCEVANPNILNAIPKVEHLQIHLSDSIDSSVDFSVCRKLKSLVHFGIPSKRTMKGLASLKNLKQVTVVAMDDDDLPSEQASKNIRTLIPGTEIKLVSTKEFCPQPTKKFQEHTIQQAAYARKRLGVSEAD